MKDKSALYIHVPYCRKKCAYCDFYSEPAGRSKKQFDAFVTAVMSEWYQRKDELPCLPVTIYLGGGTPSLLPPEALKKLMDFLHKEIPAERLTEVTIEANPEDVTPEWLEFLKTLGINRVSIGIQSFNPQELKAVTRIHSADDAVRALGFLKEGGWNYSADLIYGLPGQDLESWKDNLGKLLAYRPPHFSAYLLSYEQGTPLYARMMKGEVEEADEELVCSMYEHLCEEAKKAGYVHYEISNFALPGFEAKHNSSYWDNTPYLGLGPGAYSLDKKGARWFNRPVTSLYVKILNLGGMIAESEAEDPANKANDMIITGLRTLRGLDAADLPAEFHDEFMKNVAHLRDEGLVEIKGETVTIPEKYWLTSNDILRRLIF